MEGQVVRWKRKLAYTVNEEAREFCYVSKNIT